MPCAPREIGTMRKSQFAECPLGQVLCMELIALVQKLCSQFTAQETEA